MPCAPGSDESALSQAALGSASGPSAFLKSGTRSGPLFPHPKHTFCSAPLAPASQAPEFFASPSALFSDPRCTMPDIPSRKSLLPAVSKAAGLPRGSLQTLKCRWYPCPDVQYCGFPHFLLSPALHLFCRVSFSLLQDEPVFYWQENPDNVPAQDGKAGLPVSTLQSDLDLHTEFPAFLLLELLFPALRCPGRFSLLSSLSSPWHLPAQLLPDLLPFKIWFTLARTWLTCIPFSLNFRLRTCALVNFMQPVRNRPVSMPASSFPTSRPKVSPVLHSPAISVFLIHFFPYSHVSLLLHYFLTHHVSMQDLVFYGFSSLTDTPARYILYSAFKIPP